MLFQRTNTINLRAILRLLGILLLFEAAFMLPALAVSICYNETKSIESFLISIAIAAGCGLPAALLPTKNNDMGKREGFLLTSLTWVVFSFFGMLPFMFIPDGLNAADAYFETMSGLTTTGSSTFSSVESLPKGILLWRAITHFIGGMGIILFTLAVIPMLNKKSGIQLFNAEVTGITHDKIRPRISHTAKSLWGVYILLNVILTLLLWAGPMNLFDAICHSFSTIATGGFSTRDSSIAAFNSDYVTIVITIFMFVSGISFGLLYKCLYGNVRDLWKNDTTRWYVSIILIAIVGVGAIEYFRGDSDFNEVLVGIPAQLVSAITSTGFNAVNFSDWQYPSIIIMVILIAIGACAGSTTGGIKVDRIAQIGKNLKKELYKILYPNAIVPVRINGKIQTSELASKTGALILLYFISFLIGTFCLSLTGIGIFDSIFATLSCLSNNGLGYGFTGASYADICDAGKWIMSALMLIGRLEFFTVIVMLTKAFWKK